MTIITISYSPYIILKLDNNNTNHIVVVVIVAIVIVIKMGVFAGSDSSAPLIAL